MYINECKDLEIEVLKPDINESYAKFSVINGKIRFALESIKNVGQNAIYQIIEERKKNGKFVDFIDFCERVSGEHVNKKCIESLIKAGCFDEMYDNRFDLLGNYEIILDSINKSRKDNYKEQVSIFEIESVVNQESGIKVEIKKIGTVPTKRELIDMEKEMTGIYISGHPLDEYVEKIKSITSTTIKDIVIDTEPLTDDLADNVVSQNTKVIEGQDVIVCGLIKEMRLLQTKRGTQMAFLQLEDLYGQLEVVCFDKSFSMYRNIIKKDKIVCVKGKISLREAENPKVLLNNIIDIEDVRFDKKLYIKISKENESKALELTSRLKEAIIDFSGDTPVYVYNEAINKTQILTRNMWIDINPYLINKLEMIFGKDNIKVV